MQQAILRKYGQVLLKQQQIYSLLIKMQYSGLFPQVTACPGRVTWCILLDKLEAWPELNFLNKIITFVCYSCSQTATTTNTQHQRAVT